MTTGESAGPELVLGPMLRYVSETEATIWVETDRKCQVEVLGRGAPTFEVAGHHYGLVVIDGLAPGSEHEYQVMLDGTVRWPLPDNGFPPSVLRTLGQGRAARLAFGSCRVAEIGPGGSEGTDALAACAAMLADCTRDRWPDVLLMIGDQVYADEPGPATRRFIADHRAARPGLNAPPGEVADFEEYCALYWEAWSDPAVRWLFSVVPTAMIFDDHDVHDDWNISGSWRSDFMAKPWWSRRIESAYQSYWVYQHLGNRSPAELAGDETWGKVRGQGDAAPVLAELAHRADQRAPGIRWSFARTFSTTGGKIRLVMLDSRSRRVVDGPRLMADEGEWQWLTESVAGDWAHVVIATSVPPLLPRGIHALEAWSEAVCGGAWGRRFARLGERIRRAADLEHWAAFGRSFTQFEELLAGLATGRHGPPPATVTVISGDIHHSYLAAVEFPAGTAPRSAVYQAVCSPIHNVLPRSFRRTQQLVTSRAGELAGAALAALAGVPRPGLRWRITRGPWFHNMLAALEFDGRRARLRLDRAVRDPDGPPRLEQVGEADLS